MNKALFLAMLMSAMAMGMNGPEGPEHWQQISFVDLRVEVNGVLENREKKSEFLEKQIKRRDDALDEAKKLNASSQRSDQLAMLLNLKKEYYTARDVDDLVACVIQAKARKRIERGAKFVNSKIKA